MWAAGFILGFPSRSQGCGVRDLVRGHLPFRGPATSLNNLLDAVEQALKPQMLDGSGFVQNLGLPNMVSHCWMEGEVITDEGLVDQYSMLLVPLKILSL
jgi:hypothetical protein